MSAPVDEKREVVSHFKKTKNTHLPEDSVYINYGEKAWRYKMSTNT